MTLLDNINIFPHHRDTEVEMFYWVAIWVPLHLLLQIFFIYSNHKLKASNGISDYKVMV